MRQFFFTILMASVAFAQAQQVQQLTQEQYEQLQAQARQGFGYVIFTLYKNSK